MESARPSPPVVTPRSYCDFLEGIPGWVRTNRSALLIARVKTVSLLCRSRSKEEPLFTSACLRRRSFGHGRTRWGTVQTTTSQSSMGMFFNQTAEARTNNALWNSIALARSGCEEPVIWVIATKHRVQEIRGLA